MYSFIVLMAPAAPPQSPTGQFDKYTHSIICPRSHRLLRLTPRKQRNACLCHLRPPIKRTRSIAPGRGSKGNCKTRAG